MLAQKLFSYLSLFFLTGVLVFLWGRIELPCEKPLAYSLGSFDERFGISEEDFLSELEAGGKAWESALGRELFDYVPEAAFKVNLIFDERQIQTNEARALSDALESTKTTQEKLTADQDKIFAEYEKTQKEYESLLSSFKRQLSAYNAEVEKWNKRGGAPEDEYQNLQNVAKALREEQKDLETKRKQLNELATRVNSFSKQKVALVDEYNDKVENYLERYGEPKAFDQGDYVGTEINVYQFDDRAHLRAVLVHELGHALGLGHGGNPESIMYPLMEKQKLDPLALTDEDKTLLDIQCNQTVWDIIFSQLEQFREPAV